jgi:hypothetical protein
MLSEDFMTVRINNLFIYDDIFREATDAREARESAAVKVQ